MATMAYDSQYEDEPAKPPLSLHPAFPAIVALWFAALLGLGSLVLPAVLLERMVVATGVASIVPAAAPPLGITARGIIALAGALAGCGLGVLIARRVAQAHRPEPVSRIAKLAGGSRRPISVHDELGGEGLVNGEAPPLNRRRADRRRARVLRRRRRAARAERAGRRCRCLGRRRRQRTCGRGRAG